MEPQPRRAVLLDALGTLIEFEPPALWLRNGLRERFGVFVGDDVAQRAVAAEIAHYRANLHAGRDAAGLAALRRECAAVVREVLGAGDLELGALTDVVVGAFRFRAFPEVPAALRALRERGLRLVVVSNWDVSLHEQLAATGLDALLDGALASAEAGIAKPDPAIFARALALVDVAPEAAWHVGDDLEADVGGARAAGVRPVLIDRDGTASPPPGVPAIASLTELTALCA